MSCEKCIHIDVCEGYGVPYEPCKDNYKNAADVVEVVRCKNCEHKTTITDAITKKTSNICLLGEALNFVDENDYCSRGKRKEGVENA